MGGIMKNISLTVQKAAVLLVACIFSYCPLTAFAGDIEFSGGVTAEIDYLVDGSVWIFDANVIMYEPAHIQGFVVTGSGAVLDVYGGQIDYLLMISMHDMTLADGVVTVYGTDFAVDGVPVDPETTELFLQGQMLSGIYENGAPFAYPVDCVVFGGAGYSYYQTVKLGWLVSQPDIELSFGEYDFGQTYIGDTKTTTLTIYNLGNAGLTVQSFSLEQDETAQQFAFTTSQTLPFTLEPNTTVAIDIHYTPVIEGLAESIFSVFSNDPDDPRISTELIGIGVPVVLSAEEQSAFIIETFNESFRDGLIQGEGNAKSAVNKLATFGKMLATADELIVTGYGEYALDVLLMIEAKCDGQRSPKDFIEGQGVVELNIMINQLIETLQAQ